MIELKNIHISYHSKTIVTGDMHIYSGQITALIGQSGSGKSSILKLLSLNLPNSFESYLIEKQSIQDVSSFKKQNITCLFQKNNFIESMSCFNNLKYFTSLGGKVITNKEIQEVLKIVALDIDEKDYPKKLSDGQKQKLAIALALLKDSEIILCDEITSSLDVVESQEIMSLLLDIACRYNKYVVCISHEKELLSYCDTIYEIKDNTLHLVKESANITNQRSLSMVKVKTKNAFNLYCYQFKKRWFKIIVSGLVMSVVLAMLMPILRQVTWANRYYQQLLDYTNPEYLYIFNDTTNSNTGIHLNYTYMSFPFEPEILNQIQEIDGVESISPSYMIFPQEKVTLKEQSINLDQYCKEINTDNDGIYINDTLAKQKNIQTITSETSLVMECLIPVAQTPAIFSRHENGKDNPIEYLNTRYHQETVTFKVRGILKDDFKIYNSDVFMFVNDDLLQEITSKSIENLVLEDGESVFDTCIYRLKATSKKEVNAIKQAITKIDPNIVVTSDYDEINYVKEYKTSGNMAMFSSKLLILTGVLAGLMLIVGIYKAIVEKKDYRLLKYRGVSFNDFLNIAMVRALINSIIWSLIGFVLSAQLINHMIKIQKIVSESVIPIDYGLIFGVLLIVTFVYHLIIEVSGFIVYRKL